MSDKFKPPRKSLPRRSLLPEPSGESSTDDEANKVDRKVPYKALLIRPWPFEPFNEDDSRDTEATVSDAISPEESEESPKKNNDAINEPQNNKRRLHRRKMNAPRRIISPEAEVNQTDAKPYNSGGSEKAHSDQCVAPEEP